MRGTPAHSGDAHPGSPRSVAADPTNYPKYRDAGDTRWVAGDLEGARIQYEQARNSDPSHAELHLRIARLALEMGRSERGLEALDSFLRLRPASDDDSEIVLLRRRLEGLGQSKRTPPGSALLTTHTTPAPDPTHILNQRAAQQAFRDAEAAAQNGNWGEARTYAREALKAILPAIQRDDLRDRATWFCAASIAAVLVDDRLAAAALETLGPSLASDHVPASILDSLAALHRRPEVQEELKRVRVDRTAFLKSVGRTVNTLGMELVFVPGTDVQFATCETRVRDFSAFAAETGHKAERGIWSIDADGWRRRNHTWRDPGFPQTPDHPVCAVDWVDAMAFCDWLTRKERALGWIGPEEEYRLPTDAEWSAAVGATRFPWGDSWPPPPDAGNYFGSDSVVGREPAAWTTDLGADLFPRTAPVGSFPPNALGIHDLGGNVWEWCTDWYRSDLNATEVREHLPALDDDAGGRKYRILRGGSWNGSDPASLRSDYRRSATPDSRYTNRGFRCVLAGRTSRNVLRLAAAPVTAPSISPATTQVVADSRLSAGGPDAPPAEPEEGSIVR